MTHYNNWEEFVKENDGRLYRMYVYNKNLNERNFKNNELFDNRKPRYVFIKESILLPDGDILLGMQEIEHKMYIDEFFSECCPIQYYRLSEIWLVFVPGDL